MVYLQLEAMDIDKVQTELSVAYIDHNTLQDGFENADDHRYLRSIAAKYGIIFSPAGTGICHQVNLEYLGQTVWTKEEDGETVAYPDTCVGTDSHTTMVNGLGVLGWGVGGIASLVDIYLVLCVVWALIVITGGNLTMLNDTVMSGSLYYKVFNVFNPFV